MGMVALSSMAGDWWFPLVLLYAGPDLLLPITSALAAAAGVALMFWTRLVGWGRKLWRALFQRKNSA